jgi:hypothetical protein
MARAEQPRRGTDEASAPTTRESLMREHSDARRRRDTAPLGSDEFRRAAEDVARIEIAIAALEEPPPQG